MIDVADDIPIVHVITDDDILARPTFRIAAGAIGEVLGRSGALHIRSRKLPPAQLLAIVEVLRASGPRRTPRIVINDRVDVALACDAYGAQLGTDSMDVIDVRRVESEVAKREQTGGSMRRSRRVPLRLGVSVHIADDRRSSGADWVIAGHVFPTPTHPDTAPRGLDFISQVVRHTRSPVIAIGGIRPEHVPALVKAGASGVAAIRGIWDAPDPADAASAYLQALQLVGRENR
jgi:thiazole tautomerase (transcriptional regulator TenI)